MPKKELTIKEMSALYDRIYNIADRLIKKHNPCNIRRTKTDKLYCNNYNKKRGESHSGKLCCIGCGRDYENKCYWSESGCTTKCIACKLYSCLSMDYKVRKRLYKLQNFASKYLIFSWPDSYGRHYYNITNRYYVSKQDWLKLLKEKRSEKITKATTTA